MKPTLFIIISVMPLMALADDILPKHPDFNRYRTMLNRSFAVARLRRQAFQKYLRIK